MSQNVIQLKVARNCHDVKWTIEGNRHLKMTCKRKRRRSTLYNAPSRFHTRYNITSRR